MSKKTVKTAEAMERHSETRAILSVTLFANVLFVCFVVLYGRYGGAFVDALPHAYGDELLAQGLLLEKSADSTRAIALYEEALTKYFSLESKRTETLQRLGNLLLWNESAAAALPHLEAAYARDDHDIWLYEPLCQALIQLDRTDDAEAYAREWREKAASTDNSEQMARAAFIQGTIMQKTGRNVAAYDAFGEAFALNDMTSAAYYAGVTAYDLGRMDEARKYLEIYARRGQGDNLAWAQELLGRLGP